MTRRQAKSIALDLKVLLQPGKDFPKPRVEELIWELLETEMKEAVGAADGERSPCRLSYRSGYNTRTLKSKGHCSAYFDCRGAGRMAGLGNGG